MKLGFEITQVIENDIYITKFKNDTPYKCFIQIRPIPPKRKHAEFLLMQSECYKVLESQPIDLTRISIIFEE